MLSFTWFLKPGIPHLLSFIPECSLTESTSSMFAVLKLLLKTWNSRSAIIYLLSNTKTTIYSFINLSLETQISRWSSIPECLLPESCNSRSTVIYRGYQKTSLQQLQIKICNKRQYSTYNACSNSKCVDFFSLNITKNILDNL